MDSTQRNHLALGMGFALLGVFLVVKIAQAAGAISLGYTELLTWRHLPGLVAIPVLDVVACLVVAGLYRVLLALLGKLRVPARGCLLVVLILQGGLTLYSVGAIPFYYLYMKPLAYDQLLLVGDLRDLSTSIAESASWWILLLLVFLMVASTVGGRWIGPKVAGPLARFVDRLRSPRRYPGTLSLVVVPLAAYLLLMPPAGVIGLERNPLVEMAATASARWRVRSWARPDLVLGRNPQFPVERMFDPEGGSAESLSLLMSEESLPLQRTNVVLIILESTSVRLLGLYGGPDATSPWLASQRDRSLVFDAYSCITPVSMKSLFSIHCSLNPVTSPKAITYINPKIACPSISEILKDQGYVNALFHAGNFHYTDKDRFFSTRGYDVLRDADLLHHKDRYPPSGWGADDRAMADDAVAWLKTVPQDQPYFLTLIPVSPHFPYRVPRGVPAPFGDETDEARYQNALAFVDGAIERVMDQIGERGDLDDTLIVVVGDHGQAFREHPGNRMHGSFLYEESVRVPFVLIHPALFHGARSRRIGNHLDLVPTVLDILGLPQERLHEGQSLLRGYKPRLKYHYSRYSRYQLGLRDGRWKYIHDVEMGTDELYDLEEAPGERKTLHRDKREQVEAYRQRVLEYEQFYKQVIPAFESYYLDLPSCVDQGVCYLGDLEPNLVHGTFKLGRSAQGGPLLIDGRRYERGIGVEAPSIVRYNVAGFGFAYLEGLVGHDDDIDAYQLEEVVSSEIYVDDELVFSSGKMRKGTPAKPFRIPLDGARTVEFFGHDLDGVAFRDHINWVNTRFLRENE